MRSTAKSPLVPGILAALLLQGVLTASAADRFWGGGTASYNTPGNWTGGVVPGATDAAINASGINNVVQINPGDPDWTLNQLRAGSGAFEQKGQTLNVTNYFRSVLLGDAPGTTGAYTLSDGTLNYGGEFAVGQLGQASLTISGGKIAGSGNFAVNIGTSLDTVTSTYGGTNKSDYTWFEQGFYTPDPTRGIPGPGSTLVSETLPDHAYTLPANYAGKNAVQVFSGVPTATITFSAPTAASTLSLLGSAGFGTANLTYTVHHADATTQSGTLAVLDWFNNAGTVAHRAGGRISANGLNVQIITDGPSFPYLFSFDIAITNTLSPITSVDLTHASGGVANIFAVSSSTGGNFDPQAITGYNQDVIVEVGAPMYVDSSVTNVLTQTSGSIDISGELFVGNYGSGVYNFSGGTNTFRNYFVLGRSGGHGTMSMSGGVINKIGNGNFIMGTAHQNPSGGTPTGVLNHSAGTINCSGEFMIPENSPAAGEYHLSGTGELNVTNWMQVGRSGGSGTMTMTGGTVRKSGGGVFIVGDNAAGYLNQSGGSISVNEIWVGQAGGGNGTYDLSGTGSLDVSGYVVIGRDGTGQFNMSGGTFTKAGGGGHFIIASGGFGTLLQTGGNVVSILSDTWVAENGIATWTLSGSATATLSKLVLGLNGAGSGTLNLYGGTMTVNEIAGGGGTANLSFGGGTLVAGASGNFIYDLDAAYIETGGAIIDTAGYNVTVASPLLDFGGGALTKNGLGTLTLSGANTYMGATTVNAGELVTTTASIGAGSFAVANGAVLGVQVATDDGQLQAASVGFAGTSSTLDVDLNTFGSPGTAPLAILGALDVNGTVTVNINASSALQIGVYPLITCGSRTGAGTFVLGSLPLNTVATLTDSGTTISLNITDVNAPRWEGLDGGTWDIGLTTNWINGGSGMPTTFSEGSEVLFNDEALGTTSVNLVATVHPTSVTFDNTNLTYTLSGSGKISGATGLAKHGSGMLTIANNHDFTGPTVISAGVVSVANLANAGSPSPIGSGELVLAGGALSYAGPAAAIDRGYNVQASSSIDAQGDLTLSGVATAAANSGLTKTGPAQLTYVTAGSNYLSAAGSAGYLVRDGTVRFEGSAGPQTNIVRGGRLGIGEVGGLASVVITNSVVDASDVYLGDAADTVGSLTVDTGANLTSRSWLILGDRPNTVSTMTVNDGTVNVPNGRLFLCAAPGTMATLNINGGVINKNSGDVICIADGGWNGAGARTGIVNQVGGTVTIAPEVQIGQWAEGTGTWNLHGGTIDSTGWFVVGRSGGNGTFNIDGGTFTHSSGGQPAFIIGSGAGDNNLASVGVVNQSAGTNNCNSEYWVGENTASVGTNNISGPAVVNIGNWMSIGRGGLGVVNFLGGTITKTGNGNFIVGDGGTGIFVQSGGTLSINNEFWIGQSGSGNGTFNMSDGTTTVGSWVAVGRAGATGVWNMSGGSFTKTGDNGNHFIVGSGGSATLNQSGGTINSLLSDTWVAENSDGTWNLDGGEAILSVLHIAQNSGRVGVFNLNTNGTLTATEVTTGNAGGTSTLNLNGGTLVAGSGANASFLHGLTAANVLVGGVTIDSGANVIHVDQPLLNGDGLGGGLTKLGSGTLYLNGVNTYAGATVVNAGALGGSGTIAGPVTVNANGTLAPGASIGTLTVNNTVSLGGTTLMEISRDGGVPASDLLTVSGNLGFGGVLNVVVAGTQVLALNDTFNLFDWVTMIGTFATINLPAGYLWDTSQLYVNGTIRVVAVSPAVVNPPVVVNGNLVITGIGGPAGASYTWLTSTNVAAPVAEWTTNSTGVFDSSGGFSKTFPVNVNEPARFFRLHTP